MKKLRGLFLLMLLPACATVTSSHSQDISVATTPPGARCVLTNQLGNWEIASTPGKASVHRSFSALTIRCEGGDGAKGTTTLQPRTRDRSYANAAMLGFPAYVDAATGAGYEYDPDSVVVPLSR
ncbi:MAG: hypothetical protein WDN72_06355 [Alphaproteobacteria bacterium]